MKEHCRYMGRSVGSAIVLIAFASIQCFLCIFWPDMALAQGIGPRITVDDGYVVVQRIVDGNPEPVAESERTVQARLTGFPANTVVMLEVRGGVNVNTSATQVNQLPVYVDNNGTQQATAVTIGPDGDGTTSLVIDGSDWETDVYWLWVDGFPELNPNPAFGHTVPLIVERQRVAEFGDGHTLTVHYCTEFFRNTSPISDGVRLFLGDPDSPFAIHPFVPFPIRCRVVGQQIVTGL